MTCSAHRSVAGSASKSSESRWWLHFFAEFVFLALCSTTMAQTKVITRSYDNGRTGANTSETALTPDKVMHQGLRKAFNLFVGRDDPRIEAQPLYVPGIMMQDGKKHDVIYICTMSNNVWAFDANTGAAIWPHPTSLGAPFLPKLNDPV